MGAGRGGKMCSSPVIAAHKETAVNGFYSRDGMTLHGIILTYGINIDSPGNDDLRRTYHWRSLGVNRLIDTCRRVCVNIAAAASMSPSDTMAPAGLEAVDYRPGRA